MSGFDEAQERDMILFIGSYLPAQKSALLKLSKSLNKTIKALVLLDVTDSGAKLKLPSDPKAVILNCDFSSHLAIQRVLMPYKDRLLAVTCRAERNIPLLKKALTFS